MKQLWIAIRIFLFFTILAGAVYPAGVTLISRVLFASQASGGILLRKGQAIGAHLIGQKFVGKKYFWGRPSSGDYNPIPSGASNLGPTSEALKKAVHERGQVPPDLLFASGSGLDPEISPEAAFFQIDRVAKARGIVNKDKLVRLIQNQTKGPDLGFLGEPRVNILELNLALDEASGG